MTALMTDLKKLGSLKAPEGFAERVLVEVGMADSYAPFETVLGTVYVAWNRFGVSAAAPSESASEFEAWFQRDVGRPLGAAPAPADLAAKIEDELSGKRRMRFDLRGLTELLDERIAVVPGCEIHDDPLAPLCAACRARSAPTGSAGTAAGAGTSSNRRPSGLRNWSAPSGNRSIW